MPKDQAAQNKKNSIIKGVAVGIVSAGLILSLGSLIYGQAMSNKVLYGTKIGSVDVGGFGYAELFTTIKSESSNILTTPLKLSDQAQIVTLSDLGVEIDTDYLTDQVLENGKNSSVFNQLVSNLNILTKGQTIPWQLKAGAETQEKLSNLVSGQVYSPVDAKFTINNNLVAIEPAKDGMAVDVDGTLATLASRMNEEQPTSFEIKLATIPPVVDLVDLEPVLSQAVDIASQDLVLNYDGQKFTISQTELISWLAPIKNQDNTFGLQYNEGNLRTSLDQISQDTNKAPRAKQVSATDGSVISQGLAGKELDVDAAIKDITESLSLRVGDTGTSGEVQLVVKEVEAPVKEVQPKLAFGTGNAGLYDGKYIEVDLSNQVLYQFNGDQQIAHYIVSTGAWGTPTPIGTFAINNKSPRAYSSTYGLYMPYWMAFIGSSYGLHELPEWPKGYKEGQNHLGTPVSHGCVRLGEGAAGALYAWADIGTPVVIHN